MIPWWKYSQNCQIDWSFEFLYNLSQSEEVRGGEKAENCTSCTVVATPKPKVRRIMEEQTNAASKLN